MSPTAPSEPIIEGAGHDGCLPGATMTRRGNDTAVYWRVATAAEDPPGGIPQGWELLHVEVYGDYAPDQGVWWQAAAVYARAGHSTGVRRLIGAGPSVRAALVALEHRLADPFEERATYAPGGWDTRHQPGHVVEEP